MPGYPQSACPTAHTLVILYFSLSSTRVWGLTSLEDLQDSSNEQLRPDLEQIVHMPAENPSQVGSRTQTIVCAVVETQNKLDRGWKAILDTVLTTMRVR